ncbi:5,10-methylenetetrahydrofolate reductase [Buchnera aphidicola (Cinara pseudotaxifoliae)]|uniref:Methylenetetrahydrofolate reductase n=1 Tax=Buchnera aphidicola (Cinara pseudotaxifoliae) TaxID=655384 RepID=A0A451DG36_9GAMM|nr:methylenetetrahydrofolate reductase [Buchnera aphidicola]VFP85590.1 5,10-methylenetetrahydrofolate reductase [Buchnera aphidicola (Cinara pseudotaxifoliae)]
MIYIINDNSKQNNYESYHLKDKIRISFEVFPPQDSKSEEQLLRSVCLLNQFNPDFFSVTNSIYAKNRDKTFFIVQKIRSLTKVNVFAHFTTIGLNKLEIQNIALKYWSYGIKHIIALRGDLPDQYSQKIIYANDLIKLLQSINNFEILVAAYPELHPESCNIQEDLINLKNKADLGVKKAITQFFFSIEKFLRFRDNCIDIGLPITIIPGILPILNVNQLKKFSRLTNVYIPKWIFSAFDEYKDDLSQCIDLSVRIAVNLIVGLYNEGVTNFHLYTLNQSTLSVKICHKLGLI